MLATVYDEIGRAFRVGHQFAHGGQGAIFQLEKRDDLCIKLYNQLPDAQQYQKLRLLQNRASNLASIAALPVSPAYSEEERTTLVGVFFPFVHGRAIFELYSARTRLEYFPRADFRFLINTAYNLANAFEKLHQTGIIIGDVNEQNIRILPDASICLLDCDSFQITDCERTYPPNVGTPLWTPPELQGMDLTGVFRTTNHDYFGLAQLIFLLLFVGRHPFAGIPRNGLPLLPEDAISAYAFAFAPECLGLPLQPPPGCPPLTALPTEIQHGFLRAFREGSAQPGARPSATEWKTWLQQLQRSLTVCSQYSNHVFWRGVPTCPWCGVISETGVNLFLTASNHRSIPSQTKLSEKTFLTRLQNLAVHQFHIHLAPTFAVTPAPLPARPTGFWSVLQRCLAPSRWRYRWLSHALSHERHAYTKARTAVSQALREQQILITAYHEEFRLARMALESALQELRQSASDRHELETFFLQQSLPVYPSGEPELPSSTLHRLQDAITCCEARVQFAQENCAEQLQVSQATTAQATRQRDQAHANVQNLLKHLRNSSPTG